MKLILLTLAVFLIVATKVFAGDSCVISSQQEEIQETKLITTDVPKHLKGAVILIIQVDGSKSAVPAELFKVVPRKQQRIVTKVATNTQKVCKEFGLLKNRVSVLGGSGVKAGLDKDLKDGSVDVKSRTGFVGGVQYQRLLNEKISVGVQGQSNRTGLISVGLDF